ncbi:MAG: hypothetical protein JW757_03305 [Anaerolineales bacterium]|nr:hypothetical protein [Anaerolineales bacterium]
MKKKFTLILAIVLFSLIFSQLTSAARPALVIPTFTIQAVDYGKTVTIKGQNFIPNDIYTVTMGKFGTRGVGGVVVASQNAGTGIFTATYNIPASLKDLTTIAIRLQSPTTGYYSYNWFWNKDKPTTSGEPAVTPNPSGSSWGYPPAGKNTIPNTKITEVTKGVDVTVQGKNFTTKDTYNVYIGKMGTKGVGGVKVATFETNDSGTFTKTFNVPDSLKAEARLAIRFQSPVTGYYAYDWFINQTAASSSTPISPSPTTPSTSIGYPPNGKGTIPGVVFLQITKDQKVEVKGTNFTTNDTYKVYMGKFGTKGVGGVLVASQTTSASGTFTATYNIPDSLKGESLIAIRFESPATGYYAYDWFANK